MPLSHTVGGKTWRLEREADLEELWEAMGEDDLDEDERIPYWVELWPSAKALSGFLWERRGDLQDKTVVDAGCGMGLTTMVAAWCGARALGLDYEPAAVAQARRNTRLNGLHEALAAPPAFLVTDWRAPGLAPGLADLVIGADIMYERRFAEPLLAFLDHTLAFHGRAWIAEPGRKVSAALTGLLQERGWGWTTVAEIRVPAEGASVQSGQSGQGGQGGLAVTVSVWEVTRRKG